MINLDEKLELAKELKLKEQISLLQYTKGMFDLKFKKITMDEIRKRLAFRKFNPNLIPSVCALIMTLLAFGMVYTWNAWNETGIVEQLPELSKKGTIKFISSLAIIVSPIWLMWLRDSIRSTTVISVWVDDFKQEIPYGGLLALKESKEKGITKHQIHYPILDNPWEEFKTSLFSIANDPIISGFDPMGNRVEIYAWNENDVYEDEKNK